MSELVLYCKSYRTDLRRLVRLATSVQKFNQEGLAFHVSVPASDLTLFRQHLDERSVVLHADEEILKASPEFGTNTLIGMPGGLSQQVVKSEFWRLGLAPCYLCLDSDAFFIRPFGKADFLAPDGTPYTVIDEGHEILEDALREGKPHVLDAYHAEARKVQDLLGRPGRTYNFGPLPVVWHAKVWASLYERYLLPRAITLADAILQAPSEVRWYGEALLHYKAIRLEPCQSFFKVYHYAWQFDRDERVGMNHSDLSRLYSGVINQSAWEREMDWPREGGSLKSRIARRLRRRLGRI